MDSYYMEQLFLRLLEPGTGTGTATGTHAHRHMGQQKTKQRGVQKPHLPV